MISNIRLAIAPPHFASFPGLAPPSARHGVTMIGNKRKADVMYNTEKPHTKKTKMSYLDMKRRIQESGTLSIISRMVCAKSEVSGKDNVTMVRNLYWGAVPHPTEIGSRYNGSQCKQMSIQKSRICILSQKTMESHVHSCVIKTVQTLVKRSYHDLLCKDMQIVVCIYTEAINTAFELENQVMVSTSVITEDQKSIAEPLARKIETYMSSKTTDTFTTFLNKKMCIYIHCEPYDPDFGVELRYYKRYENMLYKRLEEQEDKAVNMFPLPRLEVTDILEICSHIQDVHGKYPFSI